MFSFRRISYFKKLLASYLIIVLVPMVLISSVYYGYYAEQIQDGMQSKAKADLDNYSGLVSMIAAEVDRLSLQFSFIPELALALKNNHYDVYNYSLLQTNMQASINSNPLIYSVYLYTKINNKVLTTSEGIFSLDEFYDKAVVEEAVKNENTVQWHEVRSLKEKGDPTGVDVITVSRRIPSASKDSLGLLEFNIRKDLFFSNASDMQNNGEESTYVVDSSSRILFPDRGKAIPQLITFARSDRFVADGLWTHGDKRELPYFIATMQSPEFGWSYVRLIPDKDYLAMLHEKMRSILAVIVIVTALFAGLSYVLTLIMYVPFKKMVAALTPRTIMDGTPERGNELTMVTSAIDQILRENEQIKSTVQQNQPIIKAHWIHDIFHQSFASDLYDDIDKLRELGLDFPYPYFIDLTVHIDARSLPESDSQRTKLLLFSLIENAFGDPYRIAGTILDWQTFGFILNMNQKTMDEDMRRSFTETAFEIIELGHSELNVNLQFLFGEVHGSLQQLNESMCRETKQLRYKAFINQVDVVFSGDFKQRDLTGYPTQYVSLLLVSIRSGDREKVGEIVRRFFEAYVYPMKYSHDQLLEMLVRILSVVLHELQNNEEDTGGISAFSVLRIHQVQSKQELEQFVEQYIDNIMDRLNTPASQPQNLHIFRATEFIKENYRNNISVSDIAEHLQISSSYLSRIFKTEMGKSPLEALTEYRIERSKMYLQDHRLSLQNISDMIGYHDVHSFIRYFKRNTGATPGEYRTKLMSRS